MNLFNIIFVTLFLPLCFSFYIPFSGPVNYCTKEMSVNYSCQFQNLLYVNRLKSEETVLPYEYNYFDFCEVIDQHPMTQNLGQILFGDRIYESMFNINFLEEKICANLCQKTYNLSDKNDLQKLNTLKKGMLKNYQHYWIIDNMPITWCYLIEGDQQFCSTSFPMGCYVNSFGRPKDACIVNTAFSQSDTFYLFNHVDLNIHYHSGGSESWGVGFKDHGGRIVQVKVRPRSIKHQPGRSCENNLPPMDIPNNLKSSNLITVNYTYSVTFVKNNNIKWSSRWDFILEPPLHSSIQWYSIMNSFVIAVFLMGMIAMVLRRTSHKCNISNEHVESNNSDLHISQKLSYSLKGKILLSAFLGSGVQLLFMTFFTLLFACLGLLSPPNRGALETFLVVSFAFFGGPAGYVSTNIYTSFGGCNWKLNASLTAIFCPGVVFILFYILDIIYQINGSSAAVPLTIILILLILWFGISFPLIYIGSLFGSKRQITIYPSIMVQNPPKVLNRSVFIKSALGIIMGDILPFSCIFIQFYYILNSIWANQTFYMFQPLFLVFLILLLTCSETSIILSYFYLRRKDYYWFWRSFLTSGFSAFYLFMYSVYYFLTKTSISGDVSIVLYFGYSLIIAFMFFLCTGTIGFFASFCFFRRIYRINSILT